MKKSHHILKACFISLAVFCLYPPHMHGIEGLNLRCTSLVPYGHLAVAGSLDGVCIDDHDQAYNVEISKLGAGFQFVGESQFQLHCATPKFENTRTLIGLSLAVGLMVGGQVGIGGGKGVCVVSGLDVITLGGHLSLTKIKIKKGRF